jgi:hypothetical protein
VVRKAIKVTALAKAPTIPAVITVTAMPITFYLIFNCLLFFGRRKMPNP